MLRVYKLVPMCKYMCTACKAAHEGFGTECCNHCSMKHVFLLSFYLFLFYFYCGGEKTKKQKLDRYLDLC